MKFGIVLPTHCYNQQRMFWAIAAFQSLAKTLQPEKRPLLLLIPHKDSLLDKEPHLLYQPPAFQNEIVQQPDSIGGTEQTLAWGTEQVFLNPDISHCVWMGDDALFNPHWLQQLENLILRHSEAKAWTVYRSAHVRYHAPLMTDSSSGDVLCRSLCGHGMTFTRWEWQEWGIHWSQGQRWPSVSGGNTLDLHHACNRPGDRWSTARSYVQHTGTAGVNVTPGVPEFAIDFVGETNAYL
jgi:hypothetical protein